jgi:hypothetical protein
MSVQTYGDAVVAGIRTATGVKDVAWQFGRFSIDDISIVSAAVPFIRIGLLLSGDVDTEPDGAMSVSGEHAIYIVTGDKPGVSRDVAMAALIQAISRLLVSPYNRFGIKPLCLEPGNIKLSGIFSIKLEKRGLAFGSMTFRQKLRRLAEDGFAHVLEPDAAVTLTVDDERFDP